MAETGARPNCMHCEYFKVSWDPNFPKACGFFGFKSAAIPSVTVFESTGKECECFVEKAFRAAARKAENEAETS